MADVVDLSARRPLKVAFLEGIEMERIEAPEGPFTVTISSKDGKMFEVEFPDYTGVLPESACIMGTTGCSEVLANLLAGSLRTFLGAR
ncbi:hypothetical protein C8D77_101207 [Mesorhizobium loti]|uniref:Uncharacterized protein n=1 Tax=Rhizobium loti TaxID=381 RepID=A0A8E2WFL2_RHILI|nr:hypothetical protein [Mesorhizobium loti]PWJ93528.1 hypothetical protein C8D77_101207 [Mesorhizobium loti]